MNNESIKNTIENLENVTQIWVKQKQELEETFNNLLYTIDQNQAAEVIEIKKKALEMAQKGNNHEAQNLIKNYINGCKNNK